MSEPDSPPSCPKCGQPLTYLSSDGEWRLYRCPTHGTVVLSPGAEMKREQPANPDVGKKAR